MSGSFLLIIVIGLLGMLVQRKLRSTFKKYAQLYLQNGMSGKEIAEKMLSDNGIHDVKVISTKGMLTDHYNPQNKTVNLSEAVYGERNAGAAAVAAHECGHALQHAQSYAWLNLRSSFGNRANCLGLRWLYLASKKTDSLPSFGSALSFVNSALTCFV